MSKFELAFGLANDFEFNAINENEMDPLLPGDPRIQGISRSKILYNPGLGTSFYNENLIAGIAINNIFEDKAVLKNDYLEYNRNTRSVAFMGSYKFKTIRDLAFEPGFMAGAYAPDKWVYNVSISGTYMNNYRLSLAYLSLEMITVHLGFDFKKYGLIYGYNTPFSSLSHYIYGSHEITFSMEF